MMKTVYCFVLMMVVMVAVKADTCSNVNCNGASCCPFSNGAQCYNPAYYTCNAQVLCPIGTPKACGQACYDPSQYHCLSNQLYQGPENQQPTAAPTQAATQPPTPRPTQPATQAPTQAPTQRPTSAPTQAPTQQCGQTNCGSYQCCNDQVTGPVCIYQPEWYDCVDNVRLCGKGQGQCNGACYDQNLYVCNNGQINQRPPSTQPTQAPTQAATQPPTPRPTQPATQAPTQAPTQRPTSAPTQPATQAPTGAPYNPWGAPTSCDTVSCPAGYQCCRATKPDTGYVEAECYLPTEYVCEDGAMCPFGMRACALRCYSPSSLKCVNGNIQPL